MSKRKIRHDYLQYHFSNIRKSLGVDLLLLSPSLINLKKRRTIIHSCRDSGKHLANSIDLVYTINLILDLKTFFLENFTCK